MPQKIRNRQKYIGIVSFCILMICSFLSCKKEESISSVHIGENTSSMEQNLSSFSEISSAPDPSESEFSSRDEDNSSLREPGSSSFSEISSASIPFESEVPSSSKSSEASAVSNMWTPDIPSTDPYYIQVNKEANCVTVYKKGEDGKFNVPVKAMVCSTGPATPVGTFRTTDQYRWRPLIHNVFGQYATRITGSILFHSVPYEKMDMATLQAEEYNKLGISASAGCVRLTAIDAKWIYDNCPSGTTVTIYNSPDPGPLGKPEAQKIPIDSQWDPTDPDENNPWKNNF